MRTIVSKIARTHYSFISDNHIYIHVHVSTLLILLLYMVLCSMCAFIMKVLPSQQFTTSKLLPIFKSGRFDFAVSFSYTLHSTDMHNATTYCIYGKLWRMSFVKMCVGTSCV